jgi:hypothetical protein
MRLATQRLQRFFQRVERGARERQHLFAFIQQVQLIEAQGADDDDLAVVVVAAWG